MSETRRTLDPAAIRLIVTDFDGIWTDGSIYLDDRGVELKRFSVYDGQGVAMGRRGGLKFAILSARNSPAVSLRAAQLGVEATVQGSRDKPGDLDAICRQLGVPLSATLYMGDDLTDLAPFRRAAIAVSVPNAPAEVRAAADRVTAAGGGAGAIREVVEWLLKEAGRWEAVLAEFQSPPEGFPEAG